jgi:beta-mannosidase
MHIQSLAGDWQFRQEGTEEWLPGHVPGGVHTDLLALNRIPDPFVADYEKRVQWVAESDWQYRRTFVADADLLSEERVFLVCDGLDTLTEVSLNGELLDTTDNAFRQYRWNVKAALREGPFLGRHTCAKHLASSAGTGGRNFRPSASGRISASKGAVSRG